MCRSQTGEQVSRLMATMSIDADERGEDGRPLLVSDPCCGTGLMLLAASEINTHAELVGQDVDARCARITAINLGLRGKFGWVICGNSLSRSVQFVYRIGSFFHEGPNGRRRGVIRVVPARDVKRQLVWLSERQLDGMSFEHF